MTSHARIRFIGWLFLDRELLPNLVSRRVRQHLEILVKDSYPFFESNQVFTPFFQRDVWIWKTEVTHWLLGNSHLSMEWGPIRLLDTEALIRIRKGQDQERPDDNKGIAELRWTLHLATPRAPSSSLVRPPSQQGTQHYSMYYCKNHLRCKEQPKSGWTREYCTDFKFQIRLAHML